MMPEKQFEFNGFDFKQAFIGGSVFVVMILPMFAFFMVLQAKIGHFFGVLLYNQMPLSIVLSGGVGLLFTRIYGKFARRDWKVTVTGKIVTAYFEDNLKKQFSLDDLEKIHINGWFREGNKSSYRWLRLTTEQGKLLFIIGNTNLIKTCSEREIAIFDEFFSILEGYALKNKFVKTDLKKSYHLTVGRNYYYQKDSKI